MNAADVAETAVCFLGLNTLAWPVLIYRLRFFTSPDPKTTAGAVSPEAAVPVASTVDWAAEPRLMAARVAAVAPPAGVTTVADPLERRRHGLPPLPPADEMKHPTLAEYARGRPRDPRTGQFLPLREQEAS